MRDKNKNCFKENVLFITDFNNDENNSQKTKQNSEKMFPIFDRKYIQETTF